MTQQREEATPCSKCKCKRSRLVKSCNKRYATRWVCALCCDHRGFGELRSQKDEADREV